MDSIFDYWINWQQAEGLNERVIRERVQGVKKMLRDTERTVESVSRMDLVKYLGMHPWSPATRQNRRSLMHTFFTWLQDEGFRPDNPAARLPRVRVPKSTPNPFTVEEIQDLINSGIYRKTRVAIGLHYFLGLRVSEISRIHGERDVNRQRMTLRLIGKGAKEALLPFPDVLHGLVLEMPSDGYWFPNHQPNKLFAAGEGHVLGRSLSESINDAVKRAGLHHRGHQLRAATATEMNRAGVPSLVVQEGMRHESMATTRVYTRIDVEQVRDGLNQLPVVDLSGQRRRRRTPADEICPLAA